MTALVCTSCGQTDTGAFKLTPEECTCECGGRMVEPWKQKPRKPLARVSAKRASTGRRRGSTLKPGKGFDASPAQREKVRGLPCTACGFEGDDVNPIDPAHLWPRGKGGCDHPDCAIPLCRRCHDLYDSADTRAEVKLLPKLVEREYHVEQAHPIQAHGVSLLTLLNHVTGQEHQALSRLRVESPERSGLSSLRSSVATSSTRKAV